MTTANKITVVRILMIPAFVTMAIYYVQSIQRGQPLEWQRFTAIAIFLVAAVSDGLDGYVARRYNQRSSAERVNSNLKDNRGGTSVRVRGAAKVFCHLMSASWC